MPHKDPVVAREYKRKYGLKLYAENPERICAYKHKWYEANRKKVLLKSYRDRALAQGVPFDLTIEDMEPPERCPVLGVLLTYDVPVGHPQRPQLDRLVPSLGYTRENVMWISSQANRWKDNMTLANMKRLVEFYTPLLKG